MAKPIVSPAGCVVYPKSNSRYSRLIVRSWGALFGGFRNRACSCVLATGVPTTPTEVERQVRRSEGYSPTTPRSLMELFRSTQVKCLPCPTQPSLSRFRTLREDRRAQVEGSVRLV